MHRQPADMTSMTSASAAHTQVQLQFAEYEGKPYATVTLNNPKRLNALSRTMWHGLQQAFEEIQRTPSLRCVLMRGWGDNFSAGGDISEYPNFRFAPESLRAFHEESIWPALNAMLQCDVPIVAQIEGTCMGGGLEIACCCDIRIAAANARFGAPIAKLGFPMAPREANLIHQTVGDSLTRRILLLAETLDAQQMHASGFLAQVADPAQTQASAQKAVVRLLNLAPHAARATKQTLRAIASGQLPTLLATAYEYAASAEHREGIGAFLQKRPPLF